MHYRPVQLVFSMEVCEHPDTPAGSFALVSLHEEIMTLQHGTEMVGYYHQISGDIYKLSGLSPRANYTDEQFLRRGSPASRFLGLRVLIPRVRGCLSLGNVSGQVEASASG